MKALKFSRQRESIRECLKNRTDHPTADAVYVTISKDYPKISLGTVYRNLNLLGGYGRDPAFFQRGRLRSTLTTILIHITILYAGPAERSLICLSIWFMIHRIFSPPRFRRVDSHTVSLRRMRGLV